MQKSHKMKSSNLAGEKMMNEILNPQYFFRSFLLGKWRNIFIFLDKFKTILPTFHFKILNINVKYNIMC